MGWCLSNQWFQSGYLSQKRAHFRESDQFGGL